MELLPLACSGLSVVGKSELSLDNHHWYCIVLGPAVGHQPPAANRQPSSHH